MPSKASGELEFSNEVYASAAVYGAVEHSDDIDAPSSRRGRKKWLLVGALISTLALGASMATLIRGPTSPLSIETSEAPQLYLLPAKVYPGARCLDGSQV
jgi:hypothetical protein